MASGYWVFHDDEGRIIMTGFMPEEVVAGTAEANGLQYAPGRLDADRETEYVKDGVLTPRPASTAVQDGHWLRSLPVPCTITVGEVAVECDEPDVELVFDIPGIYQVKVSAWPYTDAQFEIVEELHADPDQG